MKRAAGDRQLDPDAQRFRPDPDRVASSSDQVWFLGGTHLYHAAVKGTVMPDTMWVWVRRWKRDACIARLYFWMMLWLFRDNTIECSMHDVMLLSDNCNSDIDTVIWALSEHCEDDVVVLSAPASIRFCNRASERCVLGFAIRMVWGRRRIGLLSLVSWWIGSYYQSIVFNFSSLVMSPNSGHFMIHSTLCFSFSEIVLDWKQKCNIAIWCERNLCFIDDGWLDWCGSLTRYWWSVVVLGWLVIVFVKDWSQKMTCNHYVFCLSSSLLRTLGSGCKRSPTEMYAPDWFPITTTREECFNRGWLMIVGIECSQR